MPSSGPSSDLSTDPASPTVMTHVFRPPIGDLSGDSQGQGFTIAWGGPAGARPLDVLNALIDWLGQLNKGADWTSNNAAAQAQLLGARKYLKPTP